MTLPDPDGRSALLLEATGLRLARLVCVVAGVGAILLGLTLYAGLLLVASGTTRFSGSPDDARIVEFIIGGVATLLLLIGLPLLYGRGHRFLRSAIPALIGGTFALVLVNAPDLGLALGTNGADMVIVFVLGIVYLAVLVTDPAQRRPPQAQSAID